jgi:anti-sigma regulatory factor (Ser/Thr protein kinase)/CheY-like chemotaxis protein
MSTAVQTLPFLLPKGPRVLAVNDPSLERFVSDAQQSAEFQVVRTTCNDFFAAAFHERFDLIITSPHTSADQDIELLRCLQKWRGEGVKVIILARESTPQDVIAALRAHAFALFSVPFDYGSLIDMVERALSVPVWNDGIEVVSARADWIALRVRCSRVAAERLLQYGHQLKVDIPEPVRDTIMLSFRELLLNAMEHGGRFNSLLKVDIGYLRTERLIIYYIRDPGPGFDSTQAMLDAEKNAQDPLANIAARMEKGLRPGGFGIQLANEMLDSVVYNEHGNEVVLIKHLPAGY